MGVLSNPSDVQVLTTETFPFTLEWADALQSGETISTPRGYIYDNSNNILISNGLKNLYGVNGTQVQYIIDGSKLHINHTYTAVVTVSVNTGTASDKKVLAQMFTVEVPG